MTPAYVRPTAKQRALIEALIVTGTVREAAVLLGMTLFAANGQLAAARKRTGLNTAQMIYAGTRDGWLSTLEIAS